MQVEVYTRDLDNVRTTTRTVIHPMFGKVEAIVQESDEVLLGAFELPEPAFPIGKLFVSQAISFVCLVHDEATGAETFAFPETLRPYLEQFIRGDWNLTDPDDRRMNTDAMRSGNERIWDAFTCEGERYNIVCYPSQETTLMLAAEY